MKHRKIDLAECNLLTTVLIPFPAALVSIGLKISVDFDLKPEQTL